MNVTAAPAEVRVTVVTYISGDTITVDGVPTKNTIRVVALKKGGYSLNGQPVAADAVIVVTDETGTETTTPEAVTA